MKVTLTAEYSGKCEALDCPVAEAINAVLDPMYYATVAAKIRIYRRKTADGVFGRGFEFVATVELPLVLDRWIYRNDLAAHPFASTIARLRSDPPEPVTFEIDIADRFLRTQTL